MAECGGCCVVECHGIVFWYTSNCCLVHIWCSMVYVCIIVCGPTVCLSVPSLFLCCYMKKVILELLSESLDDRDFCYVWCI